jgi:cytochrome c oxidase cbb3-type subunit 1
VIRLVGGLLYLGGMVLMLYNCVMTIRVGKAEDARIPAVVAHA